MGERIPVGKTIRMGDRDRQIEADEAARLSSYEDDLPEDQWLMSLAAGIERENYVGAWVNERIRYYGRPNPNTIEFEKDPSYMFEDDEENNGYDPEIMIGARSAGEARLFRQQIDQELSQLQTISASNWGTAGRVLGDLGNPHVAASIAISPVSVLRAVALDVSLETGSEILKHSQQKTRTMEESYLAVGITGMSVAIAGTAINYYAKRTAPKGGLDEGELAEIEAGIAPGGSGDSVGAAKVLSEDTITAADDMLVGGKLAKALSIGQMQELLHSPFDAARELIQKIADNPLFTKGHTKGKTHGVTVESIKRSSMGPVVIATDTVRALAKKSGMNVDEFNYEVGVAMSAGDRHANDQVREAAELYRKEVLDPIEAKAIELKLLEGPAQVKAKIDELEVEIQTLADEGKASRAADDLIEGERGAFVTSREKELTSLTKKVAASQKKLDTARKPKADGEKRTASKELIDKHNAARRALSDYKKVTSKGVSEFRAKASVVKVRKAKLAAARANLKTAKVRAANPVTGAESYFPRAYKKDAMFANWDTVKIKLESAFKADAKLMANLESGELEELVLDTMQNMLGGRTQAVKGGSGVPSPLRARVLSLMDQELEALGIVEKDATKVMLRHAQGMQPYLIVREMFEGRNIDEMLSFIDDNHKTLVNKPGITPRELKKLDKQLGEHKTRLRVVHARLVNQVQNSIDPSNTAEKIVQFSKVWNTAVYLGGVVFSSMTDIVRPITNWGLRSFGKGMAKGFAQVFGGKEGMGSIQVKRTGMAIQRTLNDRAMQLSDSMTPMGKVSSALQKVWFKTSGFAVWTDVMESIATHTAMDWTMRMAGKAVDGKPLGKVNTMQLARMGLTTEDLIKIAGETADTMGRQDTILKYMNTIDWKDVDLAKRVESAIGGDVHRTIIQIGAAEKPAWMDGTTQSALVQFQTFAISAENKILVAGLQSLHTHRTAASLIGMVGLGSLVGAGKATFRGEDVSEWPPGQWVAEGIDRSGMIGILRIPFNLLRYAGSQFDVGQEYMGEPSRFVDREIEGAVLGPTISTLGNIGRAGVSALSGDLDKAGAQMSKAMPFLNTWHIRNIFQRLGDD